MISLSLRNIPSNHRDCTGVLDALICPLALFGLVILALCLLVLSLVKLLFLPVRLLSLLTKQPVLSSGSTTKNRVRKSDCEHLRQLLGLQVTKSWLTKSTTLATIELKQRN